MNIEMKTVGFGIYDPPPALRKFLEARASGTVSKELLVQLSAAAMAEQEAERANRPEKPLRLEIQPASRGVVLEFDRARHERASNTAKKEN